MQNSFFRAEKKSKKVERTKTADDFMKLFLKQPCSFMEGVELKLCLMTLLSS